MTTTMSARANVEPPPAIDGAQPAEDELTCTFELRVRASTGPVEAQQLA